MILDYYTDKEDTEMSSRYAKRLLVADRALDYQFKDLASAIHKKYDTAKLMELKKAHSDHLKNLIMSRYIMLILILLSAFFAFKAWQKRKNDRTFRNYIESQDLENGKV